MDAALQGRQLCPWLPTALTLGLLPFRAPHGPGNPAAASQRVPSLAPLTSRLLHLLGPQSEPLRRTRPLGQMPIGTPGGVPYPRANKAWPGEATASTAGLGRDPSRGKWPGIAGCVLICTPLLPRKVAGCRISPRPQLGVRIGPAGKIPFWRRPKEGWELSPYPLLPSPLQVWWLLSLENQAPSPH